jgi:hypothetical protein
LPGVESDATFGAAVVEEVERIAAGKYLTSLDGFRIALRLGSPSTSDVFPPYRCCALMADAGIVEAEVNRVSPEWLGIADYPVSVSRYEQEVVADTMPLVYMAVQRQRARGWEMASAPFWFSEGLALLDGRLRSGRTSPHALRSELIAWKNQQAARIACCVGDTLTFPKVPLGGAAFLMYLAERVGSDFRRALLQSQELSFQQAFRRGTQPYTLEDLFWGFQYWR